MKKAAIAMVITSALTLSACQQKEVDPLKVEVLTLETDQQKQAYALGAGLGGYVDEQLQQQQKFGISLDKELVIKGFVASIQQQSQMNDEEAQQFTQALQQSMQQAQQAQAEKASEQNLTDGKAYLEENAKREGVSVTESGLQYEVMTASEGVKPAAQDTVKVHYKGTLLDGTEFDSSYSRGEPAVFPLNRVITGWTEGVQLMSEGSKFKFHIPPELAYGKRATGKITPNSTLVFEVELLEVMKKTEPN